MSEQGHHQGWSFLFASPWLPWRKGPVFGRPAYFGYPLSYYEVDVLSWALKRKAAFRDTEPSEGKVIMSVRGYTIWSGVKMTSSRCCKNTEKETRDAPWEAGRGEQIEEGDGRRKDGEREMRGRSQEGQGRWLPKEDNIELSLRDSLQSFPCKQDGNGFVKQKASQSTQTSDAGLGWLTLGALDAEPHRKEPWECGSLLSRRELSVAHAMLPCYTHRGRQ